MSGPKHLWSGDWEQESAEGHAARPAPAATDQTERLAFAPAAPAGETPSRRPGRRGTQVIAVVALLLVAGVATAIALTVGGSSTKHPSSQTSAQATTTPFNFNPGGTNQGQATTPQGQSTTPSSSTAPQPTSSPVGSEPTVDWLGMQVQDSGSGNPPVVDTVANTGAGEAAGIEPGDQLLAVNGVQVDSVKAITSVVAKVKVGAPVTLEVNRGSTTLTTEAILSGRPTNAP
jgi:membrane-associated protease RseP (regulator of RpoE activity)